MPLFQRRLSSSEEDRAGMRAVNLDVTERAVLVLRLRQVMEGRRFRSADLLCADAVRLTVAFQTELRDGTRPEQSWVARPVRRVT